MSLPSPPFQLGKKLKEKIKQLQHGGFFSLSDIKPSHRLVTGREKTICLYWQVRESDGIIVEAKFQAFGPILLIAAAEIASELVMNKTYDQASRISADLLDRHVRDKGEEFAFPKEAHPFLNQILSAIDKAVYQCIDIPYAATDYETTPIAWDLENGSNGIAGWEELSLEKKLKILEEVIDKEIRPYIELDAGGVKIVELKDQKEVMISYEGSCTTCHSSTGSTLSAIEKILKTRIHPSLFVTPVI
jgi:NifU-like protein